MYRMDSFNRKKEYLKFTLPYARIIHEPAIKEQLAIITQQLTEFRRATKRAKFVN